MAVSCPLAIKTYLGSALGGEQRNKCSSVFFLLKTSKKTKQPQDQFRFFFQFSGEVVALQEKKDKRKSDGRVYSEKLSSEG